MNLIKNNLENNIIIEEIKQRKPRSKKINGGGNGNAPAAIAISSNWIILINI